jgi:hypothetical protein
MVLSEIHRYHAFGVDQVSQIKKTKTKQSSKFVVMSKIEQITT